MKKQAKLIELINTYICLKCLTTSNLLLDCHGQLMSNIKNILDKDKLNEQDKISILKDMDESDMRTELNRRQIEREEKKKIEKKEYYEKLESILSPDIINFLFPKHSRTSCSDDNVCNEERGCYRCMILTGKWFLEDRNIKLVCTLESYD